MAGISASDRPLSAPPPQTSSSPAARPEAGTQQAPAQPGFSGSDAFAPAGPVGDFTNQLNGQAADRAGLVNGQLQFMSNLLGSSNRAHGWHKLMMELINLMRPS